MVGGATGRVIGGLPVYLVGEGGKESRVGSGIAGGDAGGKEGPGLTGPGAGTQLTCSCRCSSITLFSRSEPSLLNQRGTDFDIPSFRIGSNKATTENITVAVAKTTQIEWNLLGLCMTVVQPSVVTISSSFL